MNGHTIRIVINQLGVGQTCSMADRQLCQRTNQSSKVAGNYFLTIVVDIPRPPAKVRVAADLLK